MFARLLFQIYRRLNPAVTIVDGILAMEGEGPGRSGVPKHLGVILGSDNGVAVDMAICTMFGIKPSILLTNKVSKELNFFDGSIEVDGDLPKIRDFSLPGITPVTMGPGWAHRFLREHFLQRPEADESICRLCGKCWEFCPAGALTRRGDKLHFNYDKCIRCYCCVEVCPHGALRTREPIGGKLLRKFIRRS
jgi:ferredoxin